MATAKPAKGTKCQASERFLLLGGSGWVVLLNVSPPADIDKVQRYKKQKESAHLEISRSNRRCKCNYNYR